MTRKRENLQQVREVLVVPEVQHYQEDPEKHTRIQHPVRLNTKENQKKELHHSTD